MVDIFKGISDGGKELDMPWGGYDFSKKSLAVVASDDNGHGAVLWIVEPHIRMDMEEGGLHELGDLGLEPDEAGIWIREGRVVYTRDQLTGETDPHTEGTFRSPTDEEWSAIRANECPWDDADWMLCFCEQGTGCPKHEVEQGA